MEVKYRQSHTDAAESLTRHQQRRIERGLSYFLKLYPDLRWQGLRFDVMLFSQGRWPCHIKNAWLVEEK